MDKKRILELAKEEGFKGVLISPELVPIDPSFRAFCEENRCGKYNANHSCPPDSGTVEEMKQSILSQKHMLVLEMILEDIEYSQEMILEARKNLNFAAIRLLEKMRALGYDGFAGGYGGCPLCTPCKRAWNEPCLHPDKKISCLSAYCINVAELAKICDLPFAWENGKLYLFGFVAFH